MSRVTPGDVRAVMDTAVGDEALGFAIDAADSLVGERFAGSTYGESRLRLIEVHLAAHFVAASDPTATRESVGDVTIEYEDVSDAQKTSAFDETRYGRRALALDTDGLLDHEGEIELLSFGVSNPPDDQTSGGL